MPFPLQLSDSPPHPTVWTEQATPQVPAEACSAAIAAVTSARLGARAYIRKSSMSNATAVVDVAWCLPTLKPVLVAANEFAANSLVAVNAPLMYHVALPAAESVRRSRTCPSYRHFVSPRFCEREEPSTRTASPGPQSIVPGS